MVIIAYKCMGPEHLAKIPPVTYDGVAKPVEWGECHAGRYGSARFLSKIGKRSGTEGHQKRPLFKPDLKKAIIHLVPFRQLSRILFSGHRSSSIKTNGKVTAIGFASRLRANARETGPILFHEGLREYHI